MKLFSKFNILFLALYLIFCPSILLARAGGAGGGHSSGGGSHSSGGYGHSTGGYSGGGVYVGGGSSTDDSFSVVLFVVIFIVIFLYQLNVIRNRKSQIPKELVPVDSADVEFLNKVHKAFLAIQDSWSQKNLTHLRRYITDGVYQRFNAQYTMMNLLSQTDQITNVNITSMNVASKRHDGIYDVIEVCIEAYAEDQFRSDQFPELNSPGGGETFTEFWSFIRRQDYKKGSNLYTSELCPNCSAELHGKLTESAQCPYCSTYLNNGEYDWVLAEITQEEDYEAPVVIPLEVDLAARLPDFSVQLVEDRASNAFMQILIAQATKQEAPLIRFTTSEALLELKKNILDDHILYDRLFLNSVRLNNFAIHGNSCLATLDVVYSFRRVRLQDKKATLIDFDIVRRSKKLVFLRELGPTKSKGSIYANSCSHCGAAQKDSLSSVCTYCNQALNDPKTEWVLDASSDLEL